MLSTLAALLLVYCAVSPETQAKMEEYASSQIINQSGIGVVVTKVATDSSSLPIWNVLAPIHAQNYGI